jgi:hypothetical protein
MAHNKLPNVRTENDNVLLSFSVRLVCQACKHKTLPPLLFSAPLVELIAIILFRRATVRGCISSMNGGKL